MRLYISLDKETEAEIVVSENGRVLAVTCQEIKTSKMVDLNKDSAFDAVRKAKLAYDEKQLSYQFVVPRNLHYIDCRGGSKIWSSYESFDSVQFSNFATPSLILN